MAALPGRAASLQALLRVTFCSCDRVMGNAPLDCFSANCYAFGVMAHASMHRCNMSLMQLATGTVIVGKVVVEGDPLPEGAVVTILAREADETFEVPPELEAELLESIAQAE